jgi:hypothetical protein
MNELFSAFLVTARPHERPNGFDLMLVGRAQPGLPAADGRLGNAKVLGQAVLFPSQLSPQDPKRRRDILHARVGGLR